jgi:pimeloyl-ACP methyl ester carboxylesterase
VEALETEDLRSVTLVGHGYGGMVMAGVAARAADRLGHLVFVDAAVPRQGDTLFEHIPDAVAGWNREQASNVGDGWRVPPPDLAVFGLGVADLAWIAPMLGAIPLRTCDEPLEAPRQSLVGAASDLCLVSGLPPFRGDRGQDPGRPGLDLPRAGDRPPSHGYSSHPGGRPPRRGWTVRGRTPPGHVTELPRALRSPALGRREQRHFLPAANLVHSGWRGDLR